MSAPEPVFEAPWHAQIFALTVHLKPFFSKMIAILDLQ